MNCPDDALQPRSEVFAEAWHAQTLAAAAGCVAEGHFSATAWSEMLGTCLRKAAADGAPDTEETYYLSALRALELLIPVSEEELGQRKSDWTDAYLRTPHGAPVKL